MKMTSAMVGYSETGRKKFTAKQWAVLIGFSRVETQKQLQIFWKHIEKDRDATKVRTIVITAIMEQQIDVDRHSSQVWFVDNVAEDIWKYRFTYRPMKNTENIERGISIMIFTYWTTL